MRVVACGDWTAGDPSRGHWAPPSVDAHPGTPPTFVPAPPAVFVVGPPAAAGRCAAALTDAKLPAEVVAAPSVDVVDERADPRACFLITPGATDSEAARARDVAAARQWPAVAGKPARAADALRAFLVGEADDAETVT